MNERHESGEKVDVLSKEQHVSFPAARAKTALSYSIVPHSTRLSLILSRIFVLEERFSTLPDDVGEQRR